MKIPGWAYPIPPSGTPWHAEGFVSRLKGSMGGSCKKRMSTTYYQSTPCSLKYRSQQWSVGKLCRGQIYLQGKGIFLLSIGMHYNTPLSDKKFRVFSWPNSKSGNWRWRSYPTLGSFWLHIHPHPHPQPKLQVPGTNQLRKKRLKRTWTSRLISPIPTLRYNRPMNIHLECPCS
jgi:hypothetical protein